MRSMHYSNAAMPKEGVIKFKLHFTPGDAVSMQYYESLNHWRTRLWEQQLIGQDSARYGGYGFGNVSQRIDSEPGKDGRRAFIISGSQTGGRQVLEGRHYASVSAYDPAQNRVVAAGPIKPSSESLSHGMVYDQSDDIHVVLHVHSPDIWQASDTLGLPVTDANVDYGTTDMAQEVKRLFDNTDVARQQIFSMGGHEDGVIAFGKTAEEAGTVLLMSLSLSRQTRT